MKYSDWKLLTEEERKSIGWHKHPHIKTATLYTIAFAVTFIIVVLGISKNSSVHLNRKPNAREASEIAKTFVKERLKQPATATFPNTAINTVIDTATNSYQILSTVKSLDAGGQTIRSSWDLKMLYKGGDWSERKSWEVVSIDIK
jgi:hypothetical protein